MSDSPRFTFGKSIKQQVAERIGTYVEKEFGGNSAKAAESLGLSRQRLFSYTSAKNLPRPKVVDLIHRRWQLDLLGGGSQQGARRRAPLESAPLQQSLFSRPVTLKSDELKVTIRRKGPRIVASVEFSTDVEIA
jgi:hypothetical protein